MYKYVSWQNMLSTRPTGIFSLTILLSIINVKMKINVWKFFLCFLYESNQQWTQIQDEKKKRLANQKTKSNLIGSDISPDQLVMVFVQIQNCGFSEVVSDQSKTDLQ